jgi:hypothetical protein
MFFFQIQFGGYVPLNPNVNFLLQYGGYSHVHVLYESTSCHELWRSLNTEATATFMLYMNQLLALSFDGRCDDDRVFRNRLDPLDRIISNLLDVLTWGAISTMPRVVALGVVSTSFHRHDGHTTMLVFFPNWLDPLDRVISNLLDGFLWGATSTTSRVVAPGVVSTT